MMCCHFLECSNQRAHEKHDWGLENETRQRRAPTKVTSKPWELKQVAAGRTQKQRSDRPSPEWRFEYVEESKGHFAYHWLSPTRSIEFMRPKQAHEFETLRSKYGSDEILAWKHYRKLNCGRDTRVVTPHHYDLPDSERKIKNFDTCKQGRQRGTTHITKSKTALRADSLLVCNDGGGK